MIPLPFMKPTGVWPPYEIDVSSIDELSPGRVAGLDVICDGILNGGEFIYPAEIDSRHLDNHERKTDIPSMP